MIDVVFLLLVFFVWTSSFELPEYDLPSAIADAPKSGSKNDSTESEPTEVFDEIVVRLLRTEFGTSITLNGDAMENANALGAKLAAILALGVQPPIIVHPDPEIAVREAIEVYDAARLAGADRVLFAAGTE